MPRRGPALTSLLGLVLLSLGGGCVGPPGPAPPPPAVHPADEFPAPPGFVGELVEAGTWAFTGVGTPAQGALFYRVSCVEFFDWRCEADEEQPDGSRHLRFTRGDARLGVQVHAAGSADSLRVLVTLQRASVPGATGSLEPNRGDVAPTTAGDGARD